MEIRRKIKFKFKGILISVTFILLCLLVVADGQRYNRRRGFYPRQRGGVQNSRIQRRPEVAGARDSSPGNRQYNAQRRQQTNTRNPRLNRRRGRPYYARGTRQGRPDAALERQDVALQRGRSNRGRSNRGQARTNSVRRRPVPAGNYQHIQNGGQRNSANVNNVQRHNVQSSGNRNNNRQNANLQSTASIQKVPERNRNGQSTRTYVANNAQNRDTHAFVKPRTNTSNRRRQRITPSRTRVNYNLSPDLSRQSNGVQALPLVENSVRRRTIPHFKPLSPALLRMLRIQNQTPVSSAVHNINSAVLGTTVGRISLRPLQPTAQSFPQRPIVARESKRLTNHQNRQTLDVNTLAAKRGAAPLNPTQSTLVRPRQAVHIRAKQNIQVLVPLPSMVPKQDFNIAPTVVVNRPAPSIGNTILQLVPANSKVSAAIAPAAAPAAPVPAAVLRVNPAPVAPAPAPAVPAVAVPVVPTVSNVVQVAANPHQMIQNQGLSPLTGLHGGAVAVNAVPLQNAHMANAVYRNIPAFSWWNHFMMGGEQPDSTDPPDPTQAVPSVNPTDPAKIVLSINPTGATKAVTELVSFLISSTQGGSSAGEEEEEEIEWEDMPPTTTTTAQTPPPLTPTPTMQELATHPPSVIKSIAQRIVSMLLQKGKSGLSNAGTGQAIPAITHPTVDFVPPTSASIIRSALMANSGSVNAATESQPFPVPTESTKFAPLFPTFPSLVANSLSSGISSNLAPKHPATSSQHSIDPGMAIFENLSDPSRNVPNYKPPTEITQSVARNGLNLNDVMLSDTLPQAGSKSGIDGVILTPYMSSNDLGGLSVEKIPVPDKKRGKETRPESIANNVDLVPGNPGNNAVNDLLFKLKTIVTSQKNPKGNNFIGSIVKTAPKLAHNDVGGLDLTSPDAVSKLYQLGDLSRSSSDILAANNDVIGLPLTPTNVLVPNLLKDPVTSSSSVVATNNDLSGPMISSSDVSSINGLMASSSGSFSTNKAGIDVPLTSSNMLTSNNALSDSLASSSGLAAIHSDISGSVALANALATKGSMAPKVPTNSDQISGQINEQAVIPADKKTMQNILHQSLASGQEIVPTNHNTAFDIIASLKKLISPTFNPANINGHPFAPKPDLNGISVEKISSPTQAKTNQAINISPPSETNGNQATSQLAIGDSIPVDLRPVKIDPNADIGRVSSIKDTIDSMNNKAVNFTDIIPLSPYLSSNEIGGLTVKRISAPSEEPGPQGVSKSLGDLGSLLAPKESVTVDTVAADIFEKIRRLMELQANPTTIMTTTPPTPTTIMTTTPPTPTTLPTSTRNVATCTPTSPNFRCKGKDLFLSMESIGAWCLGMCIKKGCVHTVCHCGCDIPAWNPSPSAQSMTDAQRRMLSVFDPPTWAITTNKPFTTDEPPEDDEFEEEEGAPITTTIPKWAEQWKFRGASPSPIRDFRLNPIDSHTSRMKKLDKHVSEINEVAWATELKSRLKQLAANSGDSKGEKSVAGWDSAPGTPPTDANTGGKAPPSWHGTEWHLPTPAPKKPPTTPESKTGWPDSSGNESPWQRRPLRDKWGRSERITDSGVFTNPESNNGWNNWNMQMQANPWGNSFGGGFDRRLSRFRFNWGSGGSGSGSGGEEQEANDRKRK